jgi:predicted metal-binding transcription factor (methanogenesis marker protein 9)
MKTKMTFHIEEDGVTTVCTYLKKGKVYIGKTKCSEGDLIFQCKLTGEHIAANRAVIASLKDEKVTLEIQAKLCKEILNQIPIRSRKSKVARDLKAKYLILNMEIESLKNSIEAAKLSNKDYIDSKDEFYKKLKENREKEA